MSVSSVQAGAQVEVAVLGSALGAHPGSEVVGVVQSAGESAQHLVGSFVIVPRLLSCGECDLCRRGRIAACAMLTTRPKQPQPQETLPARFLLPWTAPGQAAAEWLANGYQKATLSDALLSPYSGLVRAGLGPGNLCVVLGDGFRCALAVVAARLIGAQVIVLNADAEERARLCASPYGALAALDPGSLDAKAVKKALYEIAAAAGLPNLGPCLLESSGSDAGRARALSLLDAGATAVLLDRAEPLHGLPTGPGLPAALCAGPDLSGIALLHPIVAQGGLVLGAGPPHPDLLPELVALVERAQIDLGVLTRAIAPSEVEAEMERRRCRQGDALHRLTLPIVRFAEPSSMSGLA